MEKTYDLIIIGGGPAGISAGIYAARRGLKSLLIVKSFGGQMTKKSVAIENYAGFEKISGLDLIQKFKNHLKRQEIEIKEGEVRELKKEKEFSVSTKKGNGFRAKSVIVASGAKPRKLKVPGEEEFAGKGVAYCVTCDGPLFAGKDVIVAGGGNSGFEAAIALSEWASKIYLLEGGEVRAEQHLQDMVAGNEKVEIIVGALIKEINGDKFVESVAYEKGGEKKILSVQGVFVEIGSVPASGFIDAELVDLTDYGEIKIDNSNMSKTPGLFAAGDVTDVKYKQIIIACGEGAKAALSVYDYVQKF